MPQDLKDLEYSEDATAELKRQKRHRVSAIPDEDIRKLRASGSRSKDVVTALLVVIAILFTTTVTFALSAIKCAG